jgi:hypothetical protein
MTEAITEEQPRSHDVAGVDAPPEPTPAPADDLDLDRLLQEYQDATAQPDVSGATQGNPGEQTRDNALDELIAESGVQNHSAHDWDAYNS